MSNMSYCRFENTAKDMADCLSAACDVDAEEAALSHSEQRAAVELAETCAEFLETIGVDFEQSHEEISRMARAFFSSKAGK